MSDAIWDAACAEGRAAENKDPPPPASFNAELRALINRHSRESDSHTPDFILAEYLERCLTAFEIAVITRDVRQLRGEM